MLIDSSKIKDGAVIEADLCIVGSGAAGLSIASEFQESDISIAIIESGDRTYQEDAQALNRVECSELSIGDRARFRQYGGSTTEWSGKWLMLTPFDLKAKHWIENSGWPIEWDDLVEYFKRASAMHNGPDIEAYYDPATENSGSGGSAAAVFLPVSVFWLGVFDLDFSLTIGKPVQHSKHIRVYLPLTVVNIRLTDSMDTVDCLEAITREGNQVRVKARQFVLAGGGIENARLLLASNSQLVNGIGNRFGNVGRFYMDHPKGCLASVELEEGHGFPGCLGLSFKGSDTHRVDIGVRLRDDIVEAEQSVNSYIVWRPQEDLAPSQSLRRLFANLMILRIRPTQWKTYFEVLKNLVQLEKKNFFQVLFYRLSLRLGLKARTTARKYKLNFHIEQIPSRENRVSLSKVLDAHGQPLAAVDWTLADIEIRSIKLLHEKVFELLKLNQSGKLVWNHDSPPDFENLAVSDSSHHMGTTRMGDNEETSVVDSDCKIHGIQNLYIAGSSVFPNSGFANPTFTIVALAIRLGDHFKRKLL